jgi:hypothetical protein
VSTPKVSVRELIAWELDEYSYRSAATCFGQEEFAAKIRSAQARLLERDPYTSCSALLAQETQCIQHLLDAVARRPDLQEEYEYEGLEWTLGVVDLRCLLAFQRRLVFDKVYEAEPTAKQNDWQQLISLALGPKRSTAYSVTHNGDTGSGLDLTLQSNNPDLQLLMNSKASKGGSLPLLLHGGSPFFEVAEFGGRWFLRDGYHRAYRFLEAGVFQIPAVVIRARTIKELGAIEPWFFNEAQLFSNRPPQVKDFLDGGLVFCYERVAFRKVIRICVEESLQPFQEHSEA